MPGMANDPMEVKRCGKCHRTKSVKFFRRSSRQSGGFQSYCNCCINEYLREYNMRARREDGKSDRRSREVVSQ